MSSESVVDGVRILPIPPPLEFPYPRNSNESSAAPSAVQHRTTSDPTENPSTNGAISKPQDSAVPITSALPGGEGFPKRRPLGPRKKFVTDRPPPTNRASLLNLRKRQTGDDHDMYNSVDWTFDSGSSSSSSSSRDEELNVGPRRRAGTGSSHSSRKSNKKKGSSRRDSNPYSRFSVGNEGYRTKGKVSKRDGRLNISVKETETRGYLAKALGATLQQFKPTNSANDQRSDVLSPLREEDPPHPGLRSRTTTLSTISTAASAYDKNPVPALNIVIMVIGSRGDIQPFLRLGKILKEDHGHRVRIATHPAFKKFVEQDSGLEFFSVGGDPAEIMAFMVKNPGLIPKAETVKSGEIGRRRESMYQMFQGFWRACINATDDEKDYGNLKMMGDKHPFVADAIIANPPSFAHIHCAERLGIPLHLMFTFPMSPTQQFPHPLANIKQSNVDANYTNFMSYPLVEMMMWQGLGDLVNRFRVKTLGLEPVSTLWAPGQLFRLKVPYTYLWSPGLIPKPADWGPEIDITGFVFLDLASSFKPPDTLTSFLDAGDPPVYIGFGSIVVDDPDKFTSLIFEAVKKSGVRALVSKGWGGLGDENNTPDNVYMLENTPHDWLFPRVSAVVHHGGAGTTAIGLKCGKPTIIVPFFGDQPFWGAMVAKAGAGAEPIPYKRLTAEKLAAGIEVLLMEKTKAHAEQIARDIEAEGDGALNAVKSFHRSLPVRGDHSLRCSILEDHVAVWQFKRTPLRLSALAAEILVKSRKIKWDDLRLIRHYEWNDFEGPGEPFTGAGATFLTSMSKAVQGIGRTPFRWAKSVRRHEAHEKKKKKRQSRSGEMLSKIEEKSDHPQANGHAERPYTEVPDQNDSALSNGGHPGAEAHMPDMPMRARNFDEALRSTSASHNPTDESQSRTPPNNREHDGSDADSAITDYTDLTNDNGDDNLAERLAADTGAGLAKTGGALAKAPMDLSVAIAQGFHNAPRLYGDTTVRTPTRITGIRSGLKAAGEEFAYGIYDGWTGLVKQPYAAAKQGGIGGFAKGVGKGVGGWILKDLAAFTAPVGFIAKGAHKELIKGRQPTSFIRQARVYQGEKDFRDLPDGEKDAAMDHVAKAWQTVTDIRQDFEAKRSRGLRGRLGVYRERKRWQKHGVFENVEQAGRALQAEREGQDFGLVFEEHRRGLKKSQGPRKSTMGHSRGRSLGGKSMRDAKKVQPGTGQLPQDEGQRQRNVQVEGTVLAGGHTGTEVGDRATVTTGMGPGAGLSGTETLVNSITNGSAVQKEMEEDKGLTDSGTAREFGNVSGEGYAGDGRAGVEDVDRAKTCGLLRQGDDLRLGASV